MMNNRFEYKKEEQGNIVIFTLKGSLDIGTVSGMKADIDAIISGGQRKVLFDLYDLEQIDSSGIGAIIALFKRVRSNKGDVKISRLVGQPKEIFSLLRLDRVFEIHDNIEHALKSF
ncbi:anti-sigma-factor antagonist [Candidatus Vecturithrix granuli]|uniref:Anti-sigma factor antagonist n=1 Tax=Vecturithrix granuli TaxID=1499967 RepID=A0A081C4E8_VECG1|nr:anti-sigma-factor antagonist [Candidatus Vecturithrix granuli]